ncbi:MULTISPECIES: diguanylate cyclase [unclassified Paenibacillus]|uniref:GGDEF domain-containing protein n=1 Tax=unclassified Paenibacillus TaxID=185978 RepID=UPI001AE5A5B0
MTFQCVSNWEVVWHAYFSLRKLIQNVKFEHHGNPIPITISIGITEYTEESLEHLIEKADQALYQAKANGRNHVVTF